VADALFTDVLGRLADASYEGDGIIFGTFYDGNEGTAIYNSRFRPFQSPVPFLFVRHTVLATGSSSWTTTPCSTAGLAASDRPGPPPSRRAPPPALARQ
jgi:hypothetical protein